MNKIKYSFIKDGEEFTFMDIEGSNTVPYVWNEFLNDFYGLEKISLSKDDLVIDIGANVGIFSIYVKKKFGCRVISFEPVIDNFNSFKENIILNGLSLDDFELHNTAITNVEGGIINICTPIGNSGGSSIYEVGNCYECKTEKIDKYINGCVYFKIDCEGGEYDIIPDILDEVKNMKYIGIEYHQYNYTQYPIQLDKKIKDNFNGQIFSNIEDPNAIWNIK